MSNGPERLIFMGQREPDGALSWGSEILDEGYVGLPEFTAGIRPAGWSEEGQHTGGYVALVAEKDRPGFESGTLPCHYRALRPQSAYG